VEMRTPAPGPRRPARSGVPRSPKPRSRARRRSTPSGRERDAGSLEPILGPRPASNRDLGDRTPPLGDGAALERPSSPTDGRRNISAKLALPAVALLLIVLSGRASGSLIGASIVGIVILTGSVVLFGLVIWKKRFARSIGSGLGRAATWVVRMFRRSRTFHWADAAVRFRRHTIDFMVERWFWVTSTTIVSHLSLYLVLLLALRFVGVSNAEVTWAQVLGVFALGRLLTALPITPGVLASSRSSTSVV
jgi:hypothetical protein